MIRNYWCTLERNGGVVWSGISTNRKTLNISVERDRSIVVRAPHHLTAEKIDKIVQSKRQWIKGKLNHVQKYPVVTERKEFVSGETLMYLGKNY